MLRHAAVERPALHGAGQAGPVQVGAEDQEGPRASHLLLPPGHLGDALALGGVPDPDDRGRLDVAGGGCGLTGADDLLDQIVRHRLAGEPADGAVRLQEVDGRIHGQGAPYSTNQTISRIPQTGSSQGSETWGRERCAFAKIPGAGDNQFVFHPWSSRS